MQTEKQLQVYCKKTAKKRGVLAYKTQFQNKRGCPDLLLVFPGNGLTAWVELKTPAGTGALSPLQEREIRILQEQGALVYVISQPEEFDAILDDILAAIR